MVCQESKNKRLWFAQGINVGTIVTTLPDMEVRTSSNTAQMSAIFIWAGVANVVGVLLIGPLYDHINNMLLLSVCFLLMAIAGALGPTWPDLTTFHVFAAVATGLYSALVAGNL